MSIAMADESVKLWEDLFDEYSEAAAELFIVTLLRDARQARKSEEEEEQLHARVFEPWQPPLPGSALPPPATAAKRTVVMGPRPPPHLLPPRKHERTQSDPAAEYLGRSVEPGKKPRVA